MKKDTILVTMTMTMLLLALPAAASDYTLGIFGNANEDETINMQDVTFTELIILEYKDATKLADAKYDSEIDILDVTQIELIILGTEKELTLFDSADRIVTVEKPVERIVFIHPLTAESISLLGADDRVVGRDYTILTPELLPWLSELPCVNGPMFYDIDYEMVFELDPDIFIAPKLPIPGHDDVVATLEPEIPVVALNFFEPRAMVENTRKLRYILNTKEEGERFIAWHEDVINSITEKTAELTDEEKPRVFLKIPGWDPDELTTFTNEMPIAKDQMEIAGGVNIAADWPGMSGWVPEVNPEEVLEANPDVIVASIRPSFYPGSFGYDIDDTSIAMALRDKYMSMDAFATTTAVEEGRVYLYRSDFVTTPRFVVGVAYLAKWFHPELFGDDLDPKEIHQEYLTDFMGIDYDLSEHGVFAYPGQ